MSSVLDSLKSEWSNLETEGKKLAAAIRCYEPDWNPLEEVKPKIVAKPNGRPPGRHLRSSRLTPEQVATIAKRHKAGWSVKSLADQFRVTTQAIRYRLNNQ